MKDVSYRPPGTKFNLLNGINLSLPEKRYDTVIDLYYIIVLFCAYATQLSREMGNEEENKKCLTKNHFNFTKSGDSYCVGLAYSCKI